MFKYCEWNASPASVTKERDTYIVTRNVTTQARDGITVYVGEIAFMSESAYAAYIGSQQVETKREDAIIDDYTQELIEEGLI